MALQIIIFLAAVVVLAWLSSRLVNSLVGIAKFLHWREFIIAFFIMAFAASLPNLFVDINAAIHHMPEVAFGDIVGGNLVDMTLIIAIAVLFGAGSLPAESEMVQKSAIFTALTAMLPALLIWDGNVDRVDGVIMLVAFALYAWWLFSKEDRFKKVYRGRPADPKRGLARFVWDLVKIIIFLALLIIASQIIISSVKFFSESLGVSLSLVGILIVGLANCFPEMYFSIISARKGENWMILGDLMGSVIVCTTMVLGIIALFFPFHINDISPFLNARLFTVVASLVFIMCIRTGRKITKKEALVFIFIYIIFLLVEIFRPYVGF